MNVEQAVEDGSANPLRSFAAHLTATFDKRIIIMDSEILANVLSGLAMPSIFCGILFIVVSLPLLRGSIPMNRFYGFRISQAFTSDANWYVINKYGAKALILWSIVMISSGVLFLLLGQLGLG